MLKAMIYGAGSIGNHLAYAARCMEWDVLVCDTDTCALDRMQTQIYPNRYGKWDTKISLSLVENLPKEDFDVIIIGTPPDTHIEIALEVLRRCVPKVLLIEKPLCQLSLGGCHELQSLARSTGTIVTVGYNHTLTRNTQMAAEKLKKGLIGEPLTISAAFRENWDGIFAAHPWLNGPQDSYLGFYQRGGGASGEHSHAINIWQHFSHLLGMGKITHVSGMLDIVDDGQVKYDRICSINVKTEKGLVGDITQDVITKPPQKYLRIQGTTGALEWHVNWEPGCDAIICFDAGGDRTIERIAKTRPDDFQNEIKHIRDLVEGRVSESPISLERGLETMLVVSAAHESHLLKKNVPVRYSLLEEARDIIEV